MDRPLLFGKYCLLERISVGGMAEVFRAKPLDAPNPDQYFAVKRILPHLAEDVEFIKMFVDEARLTVQLNHPNIVETYELGQFQSSHYIVMEFVAGKDLLAFQKHVRNQGTTVDVDMACHIMREVAKGLNYAHNKTDEDGNHLGIIHRDISPQNILVSWDGRVRIIDFGIAKATSQSTKTKAGVMKGKFGYMSPEQVQGEEIDHRSDIFAMGTVLWELLTNRRLFKAGNQLEAMTMIGEPNVDPPSALNDDVPPEVDAIVMKMLEADPNARYHWGAELADDIGEFLSEKKPPFHPSQLTTWIRSAFRADFEEEREKREEFHDINTADDVRRRFDEAFEEGIDDNDTERMDATGMWDVDEAPDSHTDLKSFVTEHTLVQAGGLDDSDFNEWDDAPDTIDETEEVVASRIDDTAFERVPSARVKVSSESRYEPADAEYEAEPTLVKNSGDSEAESQPQPDSTAAARPLSKSEPQPQPDSTAAARPLSKSEPQPQPDSTAAARPVSKERADVSEPYAAAKQSTRDSGTSSSGESAASSAAAVSTPEKRDSETAGTMTAAPKSPARAARPSATTEGEGVEPRTPQPDDEQSGSDSPATFDKKRAAIAGFALLTVVVVGGAVGYVVMADAEGDEGTDTGELLVEVSPVTSELEIFVDDRWVGDNAPLPLEGLEPGRYSLQVDHPDYPYWQGESAVSAGEVTAVDVNLVADGQLLVRWDDNPESMELLLDGEPLDVSDGDDRIDLELARGDYLIEAYGSGVRPVRKMVRLEGESVREIDLAWKPNNQVTLRGSEDSAVKLDGDVRAEGLPVILTELERERVYEIEVGQYRAVLGYPVIGRDELSIEAFDDYADYEVDDYGHLVFDIADDTGPWTVVIDGVETGLVWPFDEIDRLPVVKGERNVGFERGGERYEYPVDVIGGETTVLRVDLPG